MNPWQRLRRRRPAHTIHAVDPHTGYDHWAARYAGEANPVLQLETAALQELLPPLAGKRVLDAGCGAGRVARLAAEGGASVVGIDFSANMLRAAREQLPDPPHVSLARADLSALPFGDERFDLVTCSLVLGHLEELAAPVGELARVTRRGGTLLVSDFHPFGHLLGWHRSYLERGNGKLTEYRIHHHLHLYEQFFDAFRQAGLRLEELREPRIDASVQHFFNPSRTGQAVFAQSLGYPAVLIFRLTRAGDPATP